MKKLLTVLLAGIMMIMVMPCNLSATESNCYIATTECPEGYMNFAEENISAYVMAMENFTDFDELKVGSPFAFADYNPDVYYFPVICDGVITYLFRVYPDGESYSAAITEFLADDIEALAHLTSAAAPMYLNMKDNSIVATINNNEYVLFEYPENDTISNSVAAVNSEVMSVQNYEVVDVKEESELQLNLIQPRVPVYNYIDLDIIETQGTNNWDTAYCLATIIRTQTPFYTTAQGLMTIAVGSNASTYTLFPWDSIATVSSQYRMNPTVLNTTTTSTVIREEIAAGRPVIDRMRSNSGSLSVVVKGYNLNGNTWCIWNPRYENHEIYSMNGAYVPTGYPASGYSYYSICHAYNFAY